MNLLYIVLIVIVIVAFLVIGVYNKLIRLRTRVEEAWSDITIQLKYRADLIPNLVKTVKGYAKHESDTFKAVTEARAAVGGAKTVQETAEAEKAMESALSRLLVVAENYPELKANQNFVELQGQLEDTEHKIQASRRFYNSNVTKYQETKMVFPNNIVAGIFNFEDKEFFEVEDRTAIEKAPEVKF